MNDLVEKMTAKYGERYRKLFVDALDWLNFQEPLWGLDEPIDKEGYIDKLMESVVR